MEENPNQDPSATTAADATSTTTTNLNDLSQDILLHILSFLPTLESITTSLISKKWKSLWSLVPSLNFSYVHFPIYKSFFTIRHFFSEFVDRTLIVINALICPLELQTGYTQYDLLGMAALLELCPNLETMILDPLYKIDDDESLSEELLNKPIHFSIPSLKEVKLKVIPGENQNQIVQFVALLKSKELSWTRLF
ncbi:hypothetical protein DKX38_022215 [Salix brachista]|uniref:F-box domain-containing protein n=1 Tax=Salix brachista TaxID=2182728 RepID=A0A5N5K0U7_9ROSI|nr:hypothetical protein DKX38_022215 [Salix brachista]